MLQKSPQGGDKDTGLNLTVGGSRLRPFGVFETVRGIRIGSEAWVTFWVEELVLRIRNHIRAMS